MIDYLLCPIFGAKQSFGLALLLQLDHRRRRQNLVHVCMPLAYISYYYTAQAGTAFTLSKACYRATIHYKHDQQPVYQPYVALPVTVILL